MPAIPKNVMNDAPFPARLHVLIPRDSKSAIVIRRGPSRQTCVFSWNTKTDEIAVSQWLKGRIYERRADISPDGRYWIYFAMNGRWKSVGRGAWTAVARAPWLKALSLMPKGDTWHGGGLFTGNRKYWLNDGFSHVNDSHAHEILTVTSEVQRVPAYDRRWGTGECPGVYYPRLERDGWTYIIREEVADYHWRTVFEKPLSHGWTLRKLCHEQGRNRKAGPYWDDHVMVTGSGDEIAFPDWEWAELIGRQVAFSRGGCLYRVQIKNRDKLVAERLIHDFNGYTFEEREAPY